MEFTDEHHGDVVILRVEGRTSAEFPRLWKHIVALTREGHTQFVVDLSGCIWLNSQTMVWFTELNANLAPMGASFVVLDTEYGSGGWVEQLEPYAHVFGALEDALEFLEDFRQED